MRTKWDMQRECVCGPMMSQRDANPVRDGHDVHLSGCDLPLVIALYAAPITPYIDCG